MSRKSLTSTSFKHQNSEKKATTFAFITVAFWSTVATAFKIGLKDQAPSQLIFIASCVTVLILFVSLFITKQFTQIFRISTKNLLLTLLLGILNPFAYYIILFKAYSLLPAQVAQPLNMIWPIVLVILSVPILKQKLNWKQLVALAISFAGVFVISSQGDFFSLKKSNPIGIALGLSSAFIWSFYWLINVRSQVPELIKLFLSFLFGTILLALYLWLTSNFNLKINNGFYAGLYIGCFEIGFAFILWIKALSLTKHNARIANLIYIAPFVSLIFIHYILKEEIYITTIVGIFFIISGILFQQTSKTQTDD
ncbi:MAG: DMT family transporter [Prolixibacteraceae bacterium]|jgi:drug/metabolite transporter (DMT)-like permease|nr:DMT family transporter [Prolixibacteraceae bacterium]